MGRLKFEGSMVMTRTGFRWTSCVLILCSAVLAADQSKDKERSPTSKRSAKTHTVRIRDRKFSPPSLTIRVGDTVTWDNQDDKDHTVIADDRSFKSDNISPDGSFDHAFKKPGTVRYGCKYHPREKGTIAVEK